MGFLVRQVVFFPVLSVLEQVEQHRFGLWLSSIPHRRQNKKGFCQGRLLPNRYTILAEKARTTNKRRYVARRYSITSSLQVIAVPEEPPSPPMGLVGRSRPATNLRHGHVEKNTKRHTTKVVGKQHNMNIKASFNLSFTKKNIQHEGTWHQSVALTLHMSHFSPPIILTLEWVSDRNCAL